MSTPHGSLVLVIAQGEDVVHEVVERGREARTDTLQVTISWDVHKQLGRLVVARPETEHVLIRHFAIKRAPLLSDLVALACPKGLTEIDPDVIFVALSTEIEPVGPMPTLSPSVPIETAHGLSLAMTLKQGDVVRAADGKLVPGIACRVPVGARAGIVPSSASARALFRPDTGCGGIAEPAFVGQRA